MTSSEMKACCLRNRENGVDTVTDIIAFDIDDLLSCSDESAVKDYGDPVHAGDEQHVDITFPARKSMVTARHLLTPACLEILQWLLERPDLEIVLFSSGIQSRNEAFAVAVMDRLIARGLSESCRRRFRVYSRNHCFETERVDESWRDRFQPPYFTGCLKKDCRCLVMAEDAYLQLLTQAYADGQALLPDPRRDAAMLANVILVEEDPSYLFPGQEENMLWTQTYWHPWRGIAHAENDELPEPGSAEARSFMQRNTLFWVAGILQRCFQRRANEGGSLREALPNVQPSVLERVPLEQRFRLEPHREGRDLLRRYRPALNYAIAASDRTA